MKNWKQRTFGSGVFFGLVAIIAVTTALFACKDEEQKCECAVKAHLAIDETCGCGGSDCNCTLAPVERDEPVTLTADKTVTVYFTAPPNVTPTWWDDLKAALINRAGLFVNGNSFTLTVTPTGTDGFAVDADGKATVSEAFLEASDYAAIRRDLNDFLAHETWIAVIESNVNAHAG